MIHWQKGRQEGGYDKLLLLSSGLIRFDMWLLRFPQGAYIPEHTDKVEEGKHYRINIILKAAKRGGEFVVGNAIINWPRLKFFRPDVSPHSVTRVEEGTRYVLSIGFVRNG